MGSCLSVHKNSAPAMNLQLSFGSKTDNLQIPSPVKDKQVVYADRTIAQLCFKPSPSDTDFRDLGSKDDTYFDSQPWLESDCDDDFLSVNGDFTPSHGSTPIHQSFSKGTSKVHEVPSMNRTTGFLPEPAPTSKKKKLADFFKESLHDDQDVDEKNTSGNPCHMDWRKESKIPAKSVNGTPYQSKLHSSCSSERTPKMDLKSERKSIRPVQCCLPKFCFGEKRLSPLCDVG